MGWRQLGTISCLSLLLTNKERLQSCFSFANYTILHLLATSRGFVCIAALQSPIIHRLSSIPQSQGGGWGHMIFTLGSLLTARQGAEPKLPCWRIRKSARRFSFKSAAVSIPSVALGKVSGKLGQSSNHLNRGGGTWRQMGKKNNGSGNRFFLFVCLLLLLGWWCVSSFGYSTGRLVIFSVWLTVNKWTTFCCISQLSFGGRRVDEERLHGLQRTRTCCMYSSWRPLLGFTASPL